MSDLAESPREMHQTIAYLADLLGWQGGARGISSDAMVREAIGGAPAAERERPWDDADMHRCYLAFDRAPEHLQRRMEPRLLAFRDILTRDRGPT